MRCSSQCTARGAIRKSYDYSSRKFKSYGNYADYQKYLK